jgi:FMN phosphatase YigB (HAD superfamily)
MKIVAKAAELANILDSAPADVRILSLDCFDTLIWRNVQAPVDVFADLPIPGGAIWSRTRAETRARRRALAAFGRREVRIEEIYRSLLPAASDAELAAAVERELEAEARHCYCFTPVADLIRNAKKRGLEVIIVSDTYLDERQLRALIAASAGEEIASLIDRIFCSSVYGMPKALGLFEPVLADLGVAPQAIVHVGDNIQADQVAPNALGINTVHFRQFDPGTEQRLRMEAAAGTILDPTVRSSSPAYQPHRPRVALRQEEDAVWTLGHDVLGPIIHSFGEWVRDEAEALAEQLGKPVKPLFVLRDGHLPQRGYEALTGQAAACVEISRFTARRAAFIDREAIEDYVTVQEELVSVDVMAQQLGLSRSEEAKLGRSGHSAFVSAMLEPRWLSRIQERASGFADRLFQHLKAAGVERGDAVMLVDLGYNGTVQDLIGPMLAERFDLTVAGRYLLLREEQQTGLDKKGLLDPRHYDLSALHALTGPIAVVEQLCTIAQGSVVDYDQKGAAIRRGGGGKAVQNELRDRIQKGCLAFVADARQGVLRAAASDGADARRTMVAATLGRLLFMPSADEVEIFQAFEHDVNLGTTGTVQLLDVDQATDGLRRHGLSYLSDVKRLYFPGELQPHGLPLNLALFSATRFGLELRAGDFQGGALKIPVIIADDRSQTVIEIEAHVTHDGYYLATIPVGAGHYAVGVQFGAVCDWLQIEEAAYYPVDRFNPKVGQAKAKPIAATAIFEGMQEEASGLYRCSPAALMLAPPIPAIGKAQHLLAITFRPILQRQEGALRKAA